MASIEYYFYGSSPFTYLGHQAICDVADKHGAELVIKPVQIAKLWEKSGSVPLPQRSETRQRYRLIELQRIARWRDLPINLHPAHFPFDATLSDRCIIALVEQAEDPRPYMAAAFKAVWVDDADMAQESEIAKRLAQCGHESDFILGLAQSWEIEAAHNANTRDAIELDAIGVPAYAVEGEVFWGQDRIEYLDHMLTTGRKAFTPNV